MSVNHQAPMKIEEEIEAALRLMGDTQPPAAMISRVHQSLGIVIGAHGRGSQGWLIWVPATAVVVIAILFAVTFQTNRVAEKQSPAVETAKMATTDSVLSDRTIAPPAAAHEQKVSAANVHRTVRRRAHVQYRHAANPFNYPLTKQEKLLVEFAQTATPEELQDLNPEYQTKMEAQ